MKRSIIKKLNMEAKRRKHGVSKDKTFNECRTKYLEMIAK